MVKLKTANDLLREYPVASSEGKYTLAGRLAGIEDGFSWANAVIVKARGEQPLYCSPAKLALTGDQLVDILRREVEKTPKLGDFEVGLALLVALQQVFPCPPTSH